MRALVIITSFALLLVGACNRSKEAEVHGAARFDQHCRNVGAIALTLIDELHGPHRRAAEQLAVALTIYDCIPPDDQPTHCFPSRDPHCMSRGLVSIASRLLFAPTPGLTPSQRQEEFVTHCRRGGIVARSATRIADLDLDAEPRSTSLTPAAQFAAYDYESCGAGDNRAHRECFFRGDVDCVRAAAKAMDGRFHPRF